MERIECTLNGEPIAIESDPERTLLEVLREDLNLTGTKYGCGEGSCRSCTVLLDGRPVSSCQTAVSRVSGKNITTIEGLADGDRLHPLQEAFIAENAMQCGYCVPGMILTAEALVRTNPTPTRTEINQFMNGNICRCCNYPNIVNAIERCVSARVETGAR
jgi:aerobic-type carbon monoxide dehydrogenase small subunit (CoxS/CutS family)